MTDSQTPPTNNAANPPQTSVVFLVQLLFGARDGDPSSPVQPSEQRLTEGLNLICGSADNYKVLPWVSTPNGTAIYLQTAHDFTPTQQKALQDYVGDSTMTFEDFKAKAS